MKARFVFFPAALCLTNAKIVGARQMCANMFKSAVVRLRLQRHENRSQMQGLFVSNGLVVCGSLLLAGGLFANVPCCLDPCVCLRPRYAPIRRLCLRRDVNGFDSIQHLLGCTFRLGNCIVGYHALGRRIAFDWHFGVAHHMLVCLACVHP